MKLRKNEWWMVIDPDGDFIRLTAATTRRLAVRQWCELTDVGVGEETQAWATDRKQGYRCLKCEIREVSE
jgi:hypothetical protein